MSADGEHNGSREYEFEDEPTNPPASRPAIDTDDLVGRIARAEEEQLSVRREVRSVRSDVGKVDDKVTAVLRGMGTIHTEVEAAVTLMQAATDGMNGRGFTRLQTWIMTLAALGIFVAIGWMAFHMGGAA